MKISAADLFDTVEVDMWGNSYTLREQTRTVSLKLKDAQDALEKASHTDNDDDQIMAMLEVLDVLLAPGDGVPPVKELLGERWRNDELGIDWLEAFSESLIEESQNRRRPTSASTAAN